MNAVDGLRRKLAGGGPLQGSAGAVPAGDFWIAHNASRSGNLLLGLLPLGDANAETLELLRGTKSGVPVVAGLCATDPFRRIERLLEEARELGAAGVVNLPSVGMIDGRFGRSLGEASLGYDREVELVRAARGAGLVAFGLAFTSEQAALMAGADALILRGPSISAPPGLPVLTWAGDAIVKAPR